MALADEGCEIPVEMIGLVLATRQSPADDSDTSGMS
jgi:hypothetical protein